MTAASISRSTVKPVAFTEAVPFGGEKNLPAKNTVDVVSNLSFQEMCVVARVSPVWNRFINFHLTDCLIKQSNSGMLAVYEATVEGDGDSVPPPFQDVKDLKRRFAALLNFSKEFRVFTDFQRAMLFTRCSRIYEVHGRSWLGFHSIHYDEFDHTTNQLHPLAIQKKIALIGEAFTCTASGEPIQGYHFGIEERRSKVLSLMVGIYSSFFKVQLLQNSIDRTLLEDAEDYLYNQMDFPFCFLGGNLLLEDLENCLSPNVMKTLEAFQNDPVSKLVLQSMHHHVDKGTMPPAKERELRLQLINKRKDALIKLMKDIALDCADQLTSQNDLDKSMTSQVREFFNLSKPLEILKFVNKTICPKIVVGLRNKMWAKNALAAERLIPKRIPAVLTGGSDHIAKTFKLMQESAIESSSTKQEKKSNIKPKQITKAPF